MKKILVVNIGSTSFKYQLFDMENQINIAKGKIEKVGDRQSLMSYFRNNDISLEDSLDTSSGHENCIKAMIELMLDSEKGVLGDLSEISAIGFKTVHAGEVRDASLITEEIVEAMENFAPIMPAHNPPYIKAIRQFQKLLPEIPTSRRI